jgi:hypothetical protein
VIQRTIVTKSELADRLGRHKSQVSRWIAYGQISAEAIVGEGVKSKIWLERAEADLRAHLAPGSQVSRERPIAVGAPKADGLPAPVDDLARRRKADADRAEADAIAAQRKNAVDEGRWIEQAAAARTWARELSKLLSDIETFLGTTLARALVDGGYCRPGLSWKELSVAIRAAWRGNRAAVATDAGGRIAGK